MAEETAGHNSEDSPPAPLTPAECDLTDFSGFMIEVDRLRQSKQWLIAKRKPEIGFYAMNLWMASWHKRPAASIEDDDDVLCDAAMCDAKKWPRAKTDVMRGWIKCADGRLYHPIVAIKALEAWLDKLAARKSSDAGNCKKYGRLFEQEPHDAAIAVAVAALFSLDPNSRKAAKFSHVRKRPAPLPPPSHPPPAPLPPGGNRDSRNSPSGSQEKGREGTLPSEEAAVVGARAPAPPTSGAIWLQRLADVRLRFGGCLDASPNANTAKHLRDLCEPAAGEACDWERDVLPAIEHVLGGYLRRGEHVSSLGVVRSEALRNRDRRLAGLPAPDLEKAHERHRQQQHAGPVGASGAHGRNAGGKLAAVQRRAARRAAAGASGATGDDGDTDAIDAEFSVVDRNA